MECPGVVSVCAGESDPAVDLGQGLAQDLEFLLFLASLATASCMRIERFQHELCTPAAQQGAKNIQLLLAGFFGGFTHYFKRGIHH